MDCKRLFRYCYGCEPGSFAQTAIITPFLSLKLFRQYCDADKNFKGKLYSGFTAQKNGKNATIIYCGMGDRLLGDGVMLLKESPVKEIIFIGSCGGLKDCEIGDLILCEDAFNGEGFSRYYEDNFKMDNIFHEGNLIQGNSDYTEQLYQFLCSKIDDNPGLKRGSIFTIGAVTSEKKEIIQAIEGEDFSGIDMEISAAYSAANASGLKATGLLFVSDLPSRKPFWNKMDPKDKIRINNAIGQIIQLSLEFASK